MIVTLVYVNVKPEFIASFIEITKENYLNSTREQGNFRFDILQDAADPGRFILYEAYETAEAVSAHKKTAHYLKWRDTVAPWMAGPREGIRYNLLFPESKTLRGS